MSDEISLRELISMKHLSEDRYPIKRVMVFLFSPDAKTIEKVGKICYNGISCGADKTKSKETEVIGFAAFVIAIVVIISLPECQCRFNRIGETDNGCSYRADRDSGFL